MKERPPSDPVPEALCHRAVDDRHQPRSRPTEAGQLEQAKTQGTEITPYEDAPLAVELRDSGPVTVRR